MLCLPCYNALANAALDKLDRDVQGPREIYFTNATIKDIAPGQTYWLRNNEPKWVPLECDDCGDRLGFVAGKFEHQGTILCQACWATDQAEAEAVRDADHRSFGGG
ncbi:MAG: hypothetical protein A2Z30_03325 [Chloroflexi bacterium RBG_16_64_43]|nr:MAG: hypothetical protein A2Z30_03325 [Chloroflexi bacterium RBG_16_64_43]